MSQEQSTALVARSQEIDRLVDSCLLENTPQEAKRAVEIIKSIKAYRKGVAEVFDEICDRTYKSWKAATSQRKKFTDPADKAEKAIKLKVARFDEWERAEQAKEHQRMVDEQTAAAEQERLAEMKQLEEAGDLDEAEALAEQPLEVLPVVKAPTTKIEGKSISYRWYAEVTNLGEFLGFMAKEPRWQHLIRDFPMKELNKLAMAQEANFNIPGCEAKKKPIVSVRS
jgi:hypothetical protein